MLTVYLALPSILSRLIESSLPSTVVLESIEIERSFSNRIYIESMAFVDDFGNRAQIQQIAIELSFLRMAIEDIKIARVELNLIDYNSLSKHQFNQADNPPETQSKLISWPIEIQQIVIATTLDGAEISLQGDAKFSSHHNAFNFNVFRNKYELAQASLTSASLEQYNLALSAQDFPVELLEPLAIKYLNFAEAKGQLSVTTQQSFTVEELLNHTLKLVPIEIVVKNLVLKHPSIGNITSPSANLTLAKNDLGFNGKLDTSGLLVINHHGIANKPIGFELHNQIQFIGLEQIKLAGQFTLKDRLKGRFQSHSDENFKRVDSSIEFSASKLDRSDFELSNAPSSSLEDFSVENLTSRINIQSDLTNNQHKLSFGETKIAKATAKIDGYLLSLSQILLSNSKILDANFSTKLEAGKIKVGNQRFNAQYLSKLVAQLRLNSTMLVIDGGTELMFESETKSTQLSSSSRFNFEYFLAQDTWQLIKKGKFTVTRLKPSLTAWLGPTTMKPYQLNSDLDGIVNIVVKQQPDREFKIKGNVVSIISDASITASRFSDIRLEANWPELQPWFNFGLSTQFKVDYLAQDQQEYIANADVLLIPDFKLKGVNIKAKLLEGDASASTPNEYLGLDDLSGKLILDKVDLEKVLTIANLTALSASGKVSGELPFKVENGYPKFEGGQLTSEKGRVSYLPAGKKLELTTDNAKDIASIALQNYHFDKMQLTVNANTPCTFDVNIQLSGRNPDLGKKQSQNFNINYRPNSNVNLFYLLMLGVENIKNFDSEKLYSGCVN